MTRSFRDLALVRRAAALVVSLALAPGMSGCTMIVAGLTRDNEEMMYEHATRDRIEAVIGPPVAQRTFDEPVTLRDQDRHFRAMAVCTADYVYRGRADDLVLWQGWGMADALTLGLFEPLMFPYALRFHFELAKSEHDYRIWYEGQGKCVDYRAIHHWGTGTVETRDRQLHDGPARE